MRVNSNNGLTPSMVLRYINSKLGTLVQKIELTNKEIMRVVYQESVPEFSKFASFKPLCNLTNGNKIEDHRCEYRIPNPWNLKILSVHKWFIGLTNKSTASAWFTPFLANPVESILNNDTISKFVTPDIIEYKAPNIVRVKTNYYNLSDEITLQFKAVHPDHLKTIEPNMRDDFLDLAYYDVCIKLIPLRKRFNTISTVYGSLEPYTELIEEAKSKRDELIERLRNNYLNNGDEKKVWIA